MSEPVTILDASGKPIASRRPSMLVGGSRVPYDAADRAGQHMRDWNPYLGSVDGDLNIYRDTIVARVRDLVRNDGWASGAVTRTLDNVLGPNFRPIFKPDYQALASHTGIKGFDHVWADEFSEALGASYRTWAMDIGKYCDAQRSMTMPEMWFLGFRHKLIEGDALGKLCWIPQRVGPGRARYATALQIVDPDRLSNPQLRFDSQQLRGGIEIDEYGAAAFYHIRRAHQGDYFSAADSMSWERVPRETDWGRPIIVHDFEHERAGQHRGGAGIFAPVLQRLKMLIKYDVAELDAAVLNAIFAAYIESPYDHAMVEGALAGDDDIGRYQTDRTAYHDEAQLKLNGARMPILYPGEKINAVTAARPNPNFEAFESAFLRNVSSATGLAAPQVTNNWAEINYSAARAALLEAWKTFARRRAFFATGFGQPIVAGFVEEAMEVDNLPLPAGAPPFHEFRTAYSRAKWMGPGRGVIDPVKERQGSVLGMDAGLSTLEDEAAELGGNDWRETIAQRAIEVERFKQHGLPLPQWAQGADATQATSTPEPT